MNSKSKWHQAKIVRTTSTVIQGGAEVLRQQQGQGARQAAMQGAGHGAEQGEGYGAGQGAGQEAAAAEPWKIRRSRG